MKNKKSQKGFSLLEILVVLTVFVIIAAIANQVFFSTLRGTSKSEATSLVKQNGNYAISVMDRSLKNAQRLTECLADRVSYLDAAGTQASFACIGTGGSDGYIASDSGRLTSDQVTLTKCAMSCTAGSPSEVIFDFTLAKKAGNRTEEQSTFDFSTRVTFRN